MKPNPNGNPAIQIQNIWVQYDQRIILEDINLDVNAGEIISIVGPNGSGKTTLLNTILGFKQPTQGTIRIFGEHPSRTKIGYLPQAGSGNNQFPVSVFDVVAFSIYAQKGLFGRLNQNDRFRINEALLQVEMNTLPHQHFGRLSGGQKQRVLIARALALQPEILILDEPSTGLDAVSQDRFYELLKLLRDEHRLTILMVSHDIGAVSGFVNRIACLNRRIHFHGDPAGCIPSEALEKVFGKHVQFVYHSHQCRTCEKSK